MLCIHEKIVWLENEPVENDCHRNPNIWILVLTNLQE